MSGGKMKKIAIGTVAAAAAGYVAGILTAPKSGKETRADIKDKASDGFNEAERQLKRLHTQLTNAMDDARDQTGRLTGKARRELEDAMDKTKLAREKARDLLSAFHEGDADDKDLRKAIKDANKSLDHLKSYLKKS